MDVAKIKQDFPIFEQRFEGRPTVYLDNAATSQRPKQVIDAINDYYKRYNATIHRCVYKLGEEATNAYEGAREKIARFIKADSIEVIFVKNATEAINLVAYSWGRTNIKEGDKILLTVMEHHSNLVPWQLLAKEKKAQLEFVDINDEGVLNIDEFGNFMNEKVKLVCVTHVSNVLGTINPIKEIVNLAHENGALVLIDGAQSVPHMPVDVREIGCDFLTFSGHKMLGPTGIGVLYGREELLEEMPPFLSGGDMIREVNLREASWDDLPWKFEAGTSNIAGTIGLGAAVDYLSKTGMENVEVHEKKLTKYALEKMSGFEKIRIYGRKDVEVHSGVISFNLGYLDPIDLAVELDKEGVAIRAGHHCAQPLMRRLGILGTARASFYIYNTEEDIDSLINALKKANYTII
ncbi:MAG: cysteine desulfurase [Candidatus Methylarchaceae archaeon HK02M2]|nr:cysteine desulfurase [Candidatus Methylarchaceae archaeon HK02M2]